MMPPLLFAHGWGFDSSFWDPVVAALPPGRQVLRVEAGYLDAPPNWPQVPAGAVLVGHSAGVASLLLRGVPPGCAGLVSINGFTRFSAGDGVPGVPERVLSRMRRAFAHAPGAVLRDFRRRCGDNALPVDPADPAPLAAGLDALHRVDARAVLRGIECPVLALAAEDDPIVPPAHAGACFDRHQLRWSPFGGHLLPLTRPDWCADMLGALAC